MTSYTERRIRNYERAARAVETSDPLLLGSLPKTVERGQTAVWYRERAEALREKARKTDAMHQMLSDMHTAARHASLPPEFREVLDPMEAESAKRVACLPIERYLATHDLDQQKALLRAVIEELTATLERLERQGIDG